MLLLSILAAGVASSGVVVNEVMFNPSQALGSDNSYEWVEIFNNGSAPVDVSGWTLTDLDTGSGCIVPAGTTMAAYSYLVFARSDTDFISHYGSGVPLVTWTGSWGSGLSNDADDVVLLNAGSAVVDSVSYDDTTAWGSDYGDANSAADCDGDGSSLERIGPSGESNNPDNWESSVDEDSGFPDADWPGHDESHGTPGAQNSVYNSELSPSTWAGIKHVF
jgi:hypothetical protein